MKLHANAYNVEKSGDFEETQYTIEGSAKAFMVLSDRLYSNKPLAVLRELSTNAYDSHVEAGCADKPFEVHLPTRLSPFVYVRDFGTSMTHDQCMKLYTTYFLSTRNDSNDAIGCLGLGSKAPFAYADSFTVEAFLNGEKRIYSAYRNSDGKHSFSLIETVATDEPNGIKVCVAVKESDIEDFRRQAQDLYTFFKVRPIITGNTSVSFSKEIPVISGDNWMFCSDSENMVIMGQIAYPLDKYSLSGYPKNISNFLDQCYGLRIFVNIGDVDITPSRESLSYSSQTKENIKNIIAKILAEIKHSVEESIKSQTTLFNARKKYVEIEHNCRSISSAMNNLSSVVEWNGNKIFDILSGNQIKVNFPLTSVYKSSYRKKIEIQHDVNYVAMNSRSVYYVDDCKRGGIGRIREYIKDSSNSVNIYVYKLTEGETVESCVFLKTLGDATASDVILTSHLPKVVRETSYTSSNGLTSNEVQYYDQYEEKMKSCNLSVKSEDAVYIPYSKGDVIINEHRIGIGNMQVWLRMIYNHRHYDKTFYFVSPSVIANRKLDSRDNWDGPEYFVKMVTEFANDNHDMVMDVIQTHEIGYEHIHDAILASSTDNNAKSIILAYREYKDRIKQNYDKGMSIYRLCNAIGMGTIFDKSGHDHNKVFKNPLDIEMQAYPLIAKGVISRCWNEAEKKAVADYIDLVEFSMLTNA